MKYFLFKWIQFWFAFSENRLHYWNFLNFSIKLKTSLALNWLQITEPVPGKTHSGLNYQFSAKNSFQAILQPSCLSMPCRLEASPAHFLQNRTRAKKFATICCRCYGDFPFLYFKLLDEVWHFIFSKKWVKTNNCASGGKSEGNLPLVIMLYSVSQYTCSYFAFL